MAMKKLLTSIILILACFSISATTFYIGLEAGGNYNVVIAGEGYKGYTYSNKFGASASIPLLVEFTPSLAIETGLSYSMKDFGYSRTVNNDSLSIRTLDYVRYNHFIELPLALRYTYAVLDNKLDVFASLGGFVGVWVYGLRSGYAYSVSINPSLIPFSEETDLSNYNIFHSGVSASAGLKWRFSNMVDAYIRAGYSLTLTDLNKGQTCGSHPVHNSTITLIGGIMWRVN